MPLFLDPGAVAQVQRSAPRGQLPSLVDPLPGSCPMTDTPQRERLEKPTLIYPFKSAPEPGKVPTV